MTSIHGVASNGQTEQVELLSASGTDPNSRDNYGQTPLHNAVLYGETETAKLLLASGARC